LRRRPGLIAAFALCVLVPGISVPVAAAATSSSRSAAGPTGARDRVSASASERAFSGLSFGGMLTNQFMLFNTSEFGYYGMMSAGFPPGTTLSKAQIAALKKAVVFVGAGWQDSIFADGFTVGGTLIHTGPAKEVRTLANAQIPVTTDFVNGGHEWYVWRILLKDFLTRVAFWPSPAATR
jgi:enterochelin esterase-like enzyme